MYVKKILSERLKNKKVLVVGLGLQGGGTGLIRFLSRYGAILTVTDLKPQEKLQKSIDALKDLPSVTFHLGKHDLNDFVNADLIFKAPKMRWDAPELLAALSKNIPVEMETSFFASLCPAPIIGITGTRGKSTTTYMIYQMLQDQGVHSLLAGNIPQHPTIELLEKVTSTDTLVLELSSWQLSGFHQKKISPHIGVFTNLYPDHMDYYHSMDEYLYDKSAVYAYQKPGDHFIAGKSLESQIKIKPVGETRFVDKNLFPIPLLHLRGDHNKENAGYAYEVARAMGLDLEKAKKTISEFPGLPNRQEKIGEKDNVIFINDTTSTTPIATQVAIQTFQASPLVLLFGGNAKRLPFDDLLPELEKTEKIILLSGSFTDQILPVLKKQIPQKITEPFNDLEKATQEAYRIALLLEKQNPSKKIIILFSPGATSFAMFNNEFHRGELFRSSVDKIINASL